MQVVQDPRTHGASQRNILTIKKSGGNSTGDTVSDDSDSDDEADSSDNEEDDGGIDDADVFALSGSVPVRQAGHDAKNVGMLGHSAQAVGGAELDESNDSDEDDYGAIDEISDSEVSTDMQQIRSQMAQFRHVTTTDHCAHRRMKTKISMKKMSCGPRRGS